MMTMVLEMLVIFLFMSWTITSAKPTHTTANASTAAATATNAISEYIAAIRKKMRNIFFYGPHGAGPPGAGPPGSGPYGGLHGGGQYGAPPGAPPGSPYGGGPYGPTPGPFGPQVYSGGWYQYSSYYGANGYAPGGGALNTPNVPGYTRSSTWSRIVDWSCAFHAISSRWIAGLLFIVEIIGIIAAIVGFIVLFVIM